MILLFKTRSRVKQECRFAATSEAPITSLGGGDSRTFIVNVNVVADSSSSVAK